jgi:general secretion pathway protein D
MGAETRMLASTNNLSDVKEKLMQNALNILMIAALTGGMATAQQSSQDMDDLLELMKTYSDEPVAEEVKIPAAEPVQQEPAAIEEREAEAVPAAPVTALDVEALIEESREEFIAGKFVEAQEGFEQVLAAAPNNDEARRYLRALRERKYRNATVAAMNEADAAWSTEIVLRSYALSSDAKEKMELADTEGAVDIEMLFPQVNFPEGARAVFQSENNILFVRNTHANLSRLEAIMDATGVLKDSGETDQVEIEAKFVEVTEGTLEELGFQWNFNDPVGGSGWEVRDGPNGLLADALRGSPTGSSPELPFPVPAEQGDGFTPSSGGWSSFRFADTFNTFPDDIKLSKQGGTEFDIIISALDQSTGADVLSAPRVLTKSGEEATIRVGERHFYPTVFEGNASQATMLNVSYEDFEETLLGVELSVTPEVDGDQIELGLNPVITELAGWQEYLMAPADSIYNHRQDDVGQRYRHNPVVAKLPVYKSREIEASVRIADGSTIGMGGLISEKLESFDDRVPIIGDIPFLGRLFRNEGERVVKYNMLIFVKATKVDPNGRVYTARTFE